MSKLRKFLRTSKILWPVRKCYAVCLGVIRFGVVYEFKWVKNKIKSRIAQKHFYKEIFLSDEERILQKEEKFAQPLCFSILVPLYNTPENFLREMIESVQQQTYGQWQLCLADGSDKEHMYVREIVEEYQKNDTRISYQKLEKNGGISENTNACIDMAAGEYIVLFDHDDLLHEAALYEIRKRIDEEKADFIFTDEAIFSKDFRRPDSYHLKTDFAIDDLRSNNYICHITCFEKGLLDKIGGGFRKDFDGSQDFDLVLRLTEQAQHIVHIPKVLYFWRCHAASVASDISAKTYCIDAGKKAIEAHLERQQVSARVCSSEVYPVIYRIFYIVKNNPLVSIIICGDNNKEEAEKCEGSIKENTEYSNYEILFCQDIKERNQVAKKATGEYLVFMDARCRCKKADWLTELLGVAQREEIGIVGPKVLYKENVIRDAGLLVGVGEDGIAGNSFYQMDGENFGYMGNLYYTHNVSAVTDTCMVIKKSLFETVGGFDETLPEWYAGIDISFKVREEEKLVAVNPYARLQFTKREKNRDYVGNYKELQEYDEILSGKWKKYFEQPDPYYNVHLTHLSSDYSMGK